MHRQESLDQQQLKSRTAVAAHLILGPRPEPFLEALCRSLDGACDTLIVNDNAPDEAMHGPILARTTFAARDSLIVDRTPFTDFSTARNVCLRLHAERGAGDWVAFVDADEVHGRALTTIVRNLARVPAEIGCIDGYTWHFFQSFHWYMSIERRMMLFRFDPALRWEGAVHEKLRGLQGTRLPVPYVYAHYGWVMPARSHAEKGRQYLQLGAPGRVVAEDHLHEVEPENYFEFEGRWANALRFTGTHPADALSTIADLERQRAGEFSRVDTLIREHQPALQRSKNAFRKLNYELRWRGRALNPLARQLLA